MAARTMVAFELEGKLFCQITINGKMKLLQVTEEELARIKENLKEKGCVESPDFTKRVEQAWKGEQKRKKNKLKKLREKI